LESVTLFFGTVGFYADESQEKETGEGENNKPDFVFAPYKSDSFDFSTAVSVFLRLVLTECHHGFVWSFV
jgi:hypothetical protein